MELKSQISEEIEFQRGADPKTSMGLGRRQSIDKWMSTLQSDEGPIKYRISDDYTINIFGGIIIPDHDIREFPDYIQFGKIHGDFMVDGCGLESLRGCPREVRGFFSCAYNKLHSLEGMPEIVFGDIFIEGNPGNFSREDVLEHTKNLEDRRIHIDESVNTESHKHFIARKVSESVSFERTRTGSKSEMLGRLGVGRSVVEFSWGKYKGQTVGEVYIQDPKYILWLAEKEKIGGSEELASEVRRLAAQYWEDIRAARSSTAKSHYGGQADIGSTWEGVVTVRNTKFFSGQYGDSYRFRTEHPDHWFEFFINAPKVAKFLGIRVKYEYSRLSNKRISDETHREIREVLGALKGQEIGITGKIKGHKDIMGHNYTVLHYVQLGKYLVESVEFKRGASPTDSLDIGLKAKAFPIITINTGSGPHRGIQAGEFLEAISQSKGTIPPYSTTTVRKDPNFRVDKDGKRYYSDLWTLRDVKDAGFSGIRWAHVFVPFGRGFNESVHFHRGGDPKSSLNIGAIRSFVPVKDIEIRMKWIDDPDQLEEYFRREKEERGYIPAVTDIRVEIDPDWEGASDWPEIIALYYMMTMMDGIQGIRYGDILLPFDKNIYESSFTRGAADPKDSLRIGRVGERALHRVLNGMVDRYGGGYTVLPEENTRTGETEFIEGIYLPDGSRDRGNVQFIRYYPDPDGEVDHFTYGNKSNFLVSYEKIATSAEEAIYGLIKRGGL